MSKNKQTDKDTCPSCNTPLTTTREYDGYWMTVTRCPNISCGYEEKEED